MSVGSSSRAEPLSESRVPAAATQLERRRGRVNEQAGASSLLCTLQVTAGPALMVEVSPEEEPSPASRLQVFQNARQYLTPILGMVLCL